MKETNVNFFLISAKFVHASRRKVHKMGRRTENQMGTE